MLVVSIETLQICVFSIGMTKARSHNTITCSVIVLCLLGLVPLSRFPPLISYRASSPTSIYLAWTQLFFATFKHRLTFHQNHNFLQHKRTMLLSPLLLRNSLTTANCILHISLVRYYHERACVIPMLNTQI